MIYGYARVSTDGQSVEAQIGALDAPPEPKRCSAKWRAARRPTAPSFAALLDQLTAGDVMMVTRLDRLARSTLDLLHTLKAVADKGAGFRSLADVWADTTTAHGRLMLTILGGLAEFERELIKARTGEGRRRAKAQGKSLGRPFKLTAHQKAEAIRRREAGEETLAEIGRSYNVSGATISRLGIG